MPSIAKHRAVGLQETTACTYVPAPRSRFNFGYLFYINFCFLILVVRYNYHTTTRREKSLQFTDIERVRRVSRLQIDLLQKDHPRISFFLVLIPLCSFGDYPTVGLGTNGFDNNRLIILLFILCHSHDGTKSRGHFFER